MCLSKSAEVAEDAKHGEEVPAEQISSKEYEQAHLRVMEALEKFGELVATLKVPTTSAMREFRKCADTIDETEVGVARCAAMWHSYMKQLNRTLVDKLNQELEESKK